LAGPVRAFTQDQQGFIWITADGVLWRWDGYELRKAGFDGMASDSPDVPEVLFAKSDPKGTLWAGTSSGLYRLDQQRLLLNRVETGVLDSQTLELVAFDYAGGKERIFLAGDNAVFALQDGSVKKIAIGGSDNRIHALLVTDNGRLWVGSNTGLLYRDRNGDQPLKAFPELESVRISALYQAADKTLFVGTAKEGVFTIDKNSLLAKLPLNTSEGLPPWIYDIAESPAGNFWFATFGAGLLAFDSGNGEFKSIRKERMLESKLLDNDIWTLFRDRAGTLWVGTRTGANFLNPSHQGLFHIPAGMPGKRLADGLVYSMEALPDGGIAVGTGSYGLDIMHPIEGLTKHLPQNNQLGDESVPATAIESMLVTPDNQLLIGSNWNTLQIDLEQERAQALVTDGRPLDAYTSDMAWFGNALWLSGTDGLWRVEDNKAVNVMAGTAGERRVSRLLVDGDTLWIGTWKGLKRLDLQSDGQAVITQIDDAILNQKFINALHKDSSGRLWVGTYGGGLLYKEAKTASSDKAWSHIGDKQGLPGNKVTGILSDEAGNLWVGAEDGLARIDARSLIVSAIRPEAGASAAPYETSVRSMDGDLLFGGSNGITVVRPGSWQPVRNQAPLVFTHIRDGSGNAMPIREQTGSMQPVLKVPADVDSVELSFAALDFINAPHLHYRYRLLGRDNEWRTVDTDMRTVMLTNLPPDDYQLEVAYSHDGKKWTEKALQLNIKVLPAWHEKIWVRMLLALLLVALLGLLYAIWSARVKRSKAALEATISERTADLEKANRLLQQQAYTIREASQTDSLTGMHNRRYFTEHIDAETQLAVRAYKTGSDIPIDQADLVFFLIDLDQFKRINDLQGHAAGDAVLIEMRQRLQSVFRGSDYLIRWGGEEFLAVARGASRGKAGELAERVRLAVNSIPFHFNGNEPIAVTCSIGFAPYPFLCGRPEALSWKETLALADAALYAAKNAGRNAWVGFNGRDEPLGSLISILRASPEAALQAGSIGVSRSDTFR
jgi:diguanylate cyclase (GGDEF)-like protein